MSQFGSQQFQMPAKPVNVINPSGVDAGQSLGLLTEVAEGSRTRANQRAIAAAQMASQERMQKMEMDQQAEAMRKAEEHWQQEQAFQEDEKQYRRMSEALARRRLDLQDELDRLGRDRDNYIRTGVEDQAQKIQDLMDQSGEEMDRIDSQIRKAMTLKAYSEDAFGQLDDRILEDAMNLAEGQTSVVNTHSQELLEAFRTRPTRLRMVGMSDNVQIIPGVTRPQDFSYSKVAEVIARASMDARRPELEGPPAPGMENPTAAVQKAVEDLLESLGKAEDTGDQAWEDHAVAHYEMAVRAGANPQLLSSYLGRLSQLAGGRGVVDAGLAAQKLKMAEQDPSVLDASAPTNERLEGDSRLYRALARLNGRMVDGPTGKRKLLESSYEVGKLDFTELATGVKKENLADELIQIVQMVRGTKDVDETLRVLTDDDPANDDTVPGWSRIRLSQPIKQKLVTYLKQLKTERELQASDLKLEGDLPTNISELENRKKEVRKKSSQGVSDLRQGTARKNSEYVKETYDRADQARRKYKAEEEFLMKGGRS